MHQQQQYVQAAAHAPSRSDLETATLRGAMWAAAAAVAAQAAGAAQAAAVAAAAPTPVATHSQRGTLAPPASPVLAVAVPAAHQPQMLQSPPPARHIGSADLGPSPCPGSGMGGGAGQSTWL